MGSLDSRKPDRRFSGAQGGLGADEQVRRRVDHQPLISSVAGLRGGAGSPAYHASKAAVRNLTKVAAVSFAKYGIRVNSVLPASPVHPSPTTSTGIPDITAKRLSKVPLGKLMSADDIAYGILHLASDASKFMTGTELVIDGGMTSF